MKITVMCLFRNSEKGLPKLFSRLKKLEKKYEMEYYFYENDSTDNTVKELEIWMLTRKGKVISEILDAPTFGHTPDEERMKMMTYYRNKLLNGIKPIDSDFCFIIDSDVDFNENIIDDYLKYMKDDVAMCTPFVKQNIKCNMCMCGKQTYYDTFAIQDKDNNEGLLLSCNPFQRKEDRQSWKNLEPVVVNSAFGGAALVRTEAVNNTEWATKRKESAFDIKGRMMGSCEHWAFCKGVSKYGKILVIPTISTFVKMKEWSLQPALKDLQLRIIEDPWQRWAANL